MADDQTSKPQTKALVFDLMGTCCNWLSSILPALEAAPPHPALPTEERHQFAHDWRAGFFKEIRMRYEAGQAIEDVDVTHRRVLNSLLTARGIRPSDWDDSVRNRLVYTWHTQQGWPDVLHALERLRTKFFIVVLANGSTRLQLDISKSSNLPFHTLLSSELLGKTKPNAAIYRKALSLMQVEPGEAIMVAAHAYDLRGASKAGMRTAYIQRTTEDLDEEMSRVRKEVDFFLDGTKDTQECGLAELADILGCP